MAVVFAVAINESQYLMNNKNRKNDKIISIKL